MTQSLSEYEELIGTLRECSEVLETYIHRSKTSTNNQSGLFVLGAEESFDRAKKLLKKTQQ